ncbi:glycosyltransferase family 2 protein [Amphritea sp. HPY]|uniref:glycosyltransferase family 2 protein n=1 Tax=Amphritea sp. HPY TaxID=3421652 RepID=UPI003D7CAD2B
MTDNPLVSVLLPAYNAEKFICRAIDSILLQIYEEFELIIVNDGSSDKTLELMTGYEDARIKIVDLEDNVGIIEALNIAISKANGKYIARMDDDDISMPQRFLEQVEFLESNPDYVACGSSIVNFNEKGDQSAMAYPTEHGEIMSALKFFERNICHPSVMIRSGTIKKNNIRYRREYRYAEDYVLWNELSAYGKLHNLRSYLLLYNRHEDQISSRYYSKQIEISKEIVKDNIGDFFDKKELRYRSTVYLNFLIQDAENKNVSLSPAEAEGAYEDLLLYSESKDDMDTRYAKKILMFKYVRATFHYEYSIIHKIKSLIRCIFTSPRLMVMNLLEIYRLFSIIKIKKEVANNK